MVMTLDQMRAFVRAHADADTADAPDETLDVYARIAYNDILARHNGWPHLLDAWTLTTVAGQREYDTAGMPVTSGSAATVDIVSSVLDTTLVGRRLIYISMSDADTAFGIPVGTRSEVATAYSIQGSQVVLFPTPSTTGKTYVVRGFRTPTAWPGAAGSVPDLPGSLHEAICWYMLSSYFMAQEDPQLAGVYMNEYQSMVDRHGKNETAKEYQGRPLVMGGQNYRAPDFSRWVRGMLE